MLLAAIGWGVFHLQPGEADAAEPLHAVRPQEIASISLEGRSVPGSALRDLLASRPGDLLDDTKLAQDRAALRDALIARGYRAASVGAAHITYDARGAAYVTFAIVPGPLYHVRAVELTGVSARDAGVVTIVKNDPVEPDRLARARQALTDRLHARGKPLAVTVEMHADDATAAVDVELVAR
jgi:outer membrane protein assembly factor BamA